MVTCEGCGYEIESYIYTEFDHDDYGTDIIEVVDHDCVIDTCTEFGEVRIIDGEITLQ